MHGTNCYSLAHTAGKPKEGTVWQWARKKIFRQFSTHCYDWSASQRVQRTFEIESESPSASKWPITSSTAGVINDAKTMSRFSSSESYSEHIFMRARRPWRSHDLHNTLAYGLAGTATTRICALSRQRGCPKTKRSLVNQVPLPSRQNA